MIELLTDFLFKLAAYLTPFIVRRFYSVHKLTEQIKIRIQCEGDGIVFTNSDLPNVRIWIRITNLSPIDIEFDRIFGNVIHGSQLAEFRDLQRRCVPTTSELDFLIETSLGAEQIAFIQKNRPQRFDTHLDLSGYVHSRLYTYQLPFQRIQTKNVQFMNFQ